MRRIEFPPILKNLHGKDRINMLYKINVEKKRKDCPWVLTYISARSRCAKYGCYYKYGIKFFMTVDDFKFLWFRDKAYLMNKPSVDRIDSKKDYTLDNCRYLEFYENISREHKATNSKTQRQCSSCRNIYPLEHNYFYRNRGTKSGFEFRCRKCSREHTRIRQSKKQEN